MTVPKRTFRSADDIEWQVEVRSPTSSSAMVVFRHPDGTTSRMDRYNWYQWRGPEAAAVMASLKPKTVLDRLSDADLSQLFRRSMPVHTTRETASFIPPGPALK